MPSYQPQQEEKAVENRIMMERMIISVAADCEKYIRGQDC